MKLRERKYYLVCQNCGTRVGQFTDWFAANQNCNQCGHAIADVEFSEGYDALPQLIENTDNPRSLWVYESYLPINESENVISFDEGVVPIQRWEFLERYVEKYFGIQCKIYGHRNDLNPATGTFKDLAGTLVASVLNENQRKGYVVASTGNTATAYSKYLSAARINVYAFIPKYSSKIQEAEIGVYGQKVFRVKGDYEDTKSIAREFAQKHGLLLAAGNFDPMRIEAKKTMVYEWLRQLGEVPTVYCQALSGGTGPLGIAKACKELKNSGFSGKIPRQLLVQTNKCSPMADAWENAKKLGFPAGWEYNYPIYRNPDTEIATLTTGNPKTFPVISKLVQDSRGEIIAYNEEKAIDVARLIAYEVSVILGPAAAIPVGGFLESIKKGFLNDGDSVILNIGEGARRSPKFMERTIYTSETVGSSEDTHLFNRQQIRDQLWRSVF